MFELPDDLNRCSNQGKHTLVLFSGPECPMCAAEEESDRRVAVVEEKLAYAQQLIEEYKEAAL